MSYNQTQMMGPPHPYAQPMRAPQHPYAPPVMGTSAPIGHQPHMDTTQMMYPMSLYQMPMMYPQTSMDSRMPQQIVHHVCPSDDVPDGPPASHGPVRPDAPCHLLAEEAVEAVDMKPLIADRDPTVPPVAEPELAVTAADAVEAEAVPAARRGGGCGRGREYRPGGPNERVGRLLWVGHLCTSPGTPTSSKTGGPKKCSDGNLIHDRRDQANAVRRLGAKKLARSTKRTPKKYCGAYRAEGSHYTSAHKEELGFRFKVYPRLNDAMKKGGPGARMIRDAIDYYGIN
ncbi:unnamed protein product, partial [Mesorhabditis spiculigera]